MESNRPVRHEESWETAAMKSAPGATATAAMLGADRAPQATETPNLDEMRVNLNAGREKTPLTVSLEQFFDFSFQISESLQELVETWQRPGA